MVKITRSNIMENKGIGKIFTVCKPKVFRIRNTAYYTDIMVTLQQCALGFHHCGRCLIIHLFVFDVFINYLTLKNRKALLSYIKNKKDMINDRQKAKKTLKGPRNEKHN